LGISFIYEVSEEMDNKNIFLENKISDGYKTCWLTVADAERWAADIYNDRSSDQDDIKVMLNDILSNTKMKITDESIMTSMLWSAVKMFTSSNYDALKICIKALDEYADTSYKLAKLLLLAQSTGHSVDDLTFDKKKINSSLIMDAISMLRTERNGHFTEASELLRKLEVALKDADIEYLLKENTDHSNSNVVSNTNSGHSSPMEKWIKEHNDLIQKACYEENAFVLLINEIAKYSESIEDREMLYNEIEDSWERKNLFGAVVLNNGGFAICDAQHCD